MTEIKYPFAEFFCSPQGEGLHCGQLMNFIRIGGCSVGKPFPKEKYIPGKPGEIRTMETEWTKIAKQTLGGGPQLLPIYTEMCTTYDGRTFPCDTDYRVRARLTPDEVIKMIPNPNVKAICLTGGEPMMHNLSPLVDKFHSEGYQVNIETSGTIPMKKTFPDDWGDEATIRGYKTDDVWITVSPKFGVLDEMLVRADEIKLLIDDGFDIEKVPDLVKQEHKLVYIQPINGENTIDYVNVQKCVQLQEKYPNWRISIQMHKVLHVR